MAVANSIDAPSYTVRPSNHELTSDDDIIGRALNILESRFGTPGRCVMAGLAGVKHYLRLKLADKPYEVFGVMFLDAQNRVIAFEEMFRGTLTQTSVYPREVVKTALKHNAASVILSHNHPSGSVEPSRADEALTQTLKSALALIDCRVMDHVIVSAEASLSMAERGLL